MFAARRRLRRPRIAAPRTDAPPEEPTTPAVTQDPATVWPRIQDELRRAVAGLHLRDLARAAASASRSTATLVLRRGARRRAARPGSPTASAGVAAVVAPRRSLGPRGRRVDARSAAPARAAPRGAGARRRPRRRRRPPDAGRPPADDDAQPEVHLRPVRHRRRQPLRPRRGARRRRAARARPTTRSSSTARPGVGKTHLLHSIGNYVRATAAGLTVRYATVEAFTNEFVARAARRRHRALQGALPPASTCCSSTTSSSSQSKAKTEEEFFHTFNALHDTGSQLVLTSDRLPRDLDGARRPPARALRGRPVTDIQPPDRRHADDRAAQARRPRRHRARRRGGPRAHRRRASTDNVRALEGALIRVVAFASLTGRPLDRRRSPRRCSTASTARAARGAGSGAHAHPRADPGRSPARPSASRREELALAEPHRPRRLAAPGRHVPRARAHRRRRSRPSAAPSAAATTRPSCTPAGAPPSASPPTPRPTTPFGDDSTRARSPPVTTGPPCTTARSRDRPDRRP